MLRKFLTLGICFLFLLSALYGQTTETWGENTADDYTSVSTDTDMDEYNSAVNYGGDSELRLKFFAGYSLHFVIDFDLAALTGQTITDASFYMHVEAQPAVEVTDRLWSCQDVFVEMQATWDEKSTGNAWTGTHGQQTNLDDAVIATDASGYQEFTSANLITYLNTVDDGIARFSLECITSNNTIQRYDSSESADGQRPYLSITYEAEAGEEESAIFFGMNFLTCLLFLITFNEVRR